MFDRLRLIDLDLNEKRVLVRVDFNVPMKDGMVLDESRIIAALPTINYIRERGGMVILCSHLGRPKGKVVKDLSLKPIGERLSELLGCEVKRASRCVGEDVRNLVKGMRPRDVIILENTRFHKEEEVNDPEFSKELASLADLYVNDAFGAAHRRHASLVGVTRFISASAAGFLLLKEVLTLSKLLVSPERPFITLLGGAKVSSKIDVVRNLLNKADALLIGGAMACTFLKAQGFSMGETAIEEDKIEAAREILYEGMVKGVPIFLPVDLLGARTIEESSSTRLFYRGEVPDGWKVIDIGKVTIDEFSHILSKAKTIFWNGPVGIFEIDEFSKGTSMIAGLLAKLDATTIIGGGDSISAVKRFGFGDKMNHLSTGGGACLEFLAGKELPAIAALTPRRRME
jgi:phosphoglycerate kinase